MPDASIAPARATTIIDNRHGNTLLTALQSMAGGARELHVATAFFSLDALLLLADVIASVDRVRLLFGDDSSPRQRQELLSRLQATSDPDLLARREEQPLLSPLQEVEKAFQEGRVEARCYTREKFHAKAYLLQRPEVYPNRMGIIGSGNFTRPGLTRNIELNVELTPEQSAHLEQWFDERWDEAATDIVTEDVLREIRRQIQLYDPYILYLKALYTWGFYVQGGSGAPDEVALFDSLDPHQQQAYRQALLILERNHGVMICDGVGLGKSYIALALMERMCRQGQNVLLIAPRNILEVTWKPYLDRYLADFRSPFGNIHDMAMTELGFPPEGEDAGEGEEVRRIRERRRHLRRLQERASVIVVDESHNFRSTSSARHRNLQAIVKPVRGRRKKIIMLTATPINNHYADLSAQLSFITQDHGTIGGYTGVQINRFANTLDRERGNQIQGPQGVLDLLSKPEESLSRVLEQVVIQRSRKTCKEQSAAAGRPIRFPERKGPVVLSYRIRDVSPLVSHALELAEKRFRPLSYLIKKLREVKEDADPAEAALLLEAGGKRRYSGIKLAAFLPEQYATQPRPGQKTYQDEVRLAGLVYSNTLKQLESSLPAFQSILQSLGAGLIARLEFMLADAARPLTSPHLGWVRTEVFPDGADQDEEDAGSDVIEDGELLDASGGEVDEWVQQMVRSRQLERKLKDYGPENFHLERWRDDIVQDLGYLREIHTAVLQARGAPDPKFEAIYPEVLRELEKGRRVLVFTQSQVTARYIEEQFRSRLNGRFNVARIDSSVASTRASILHAFCPGYNPAPDRWSPSVPRQVHLLISTDILSEGVNLQEAGAIFNWDIHWNPVRLIQRIGRVDRRLDPAITPGEHSFTIYNVFPPEEIEKIIRLVDTVEGRTLNISRTLGIDMAFFTPDDPAGSLREFNARYEGESTPKDEALTEFIRFVNGPEQGLIKTLEALPAGAFGVWENAPFNGLFALFTMKAADHATEADREKFAGVLGRPVLALLKEQEERTDAADILQILRRTRRGEPSGMPGPEDSLKANLRRLKNAVRQQFATIQLPRGIVPELVCWMELKKASGHSGV